jgi:hypothetical protein
MDWSLLPPKPPVALLMPVAFSFVVFSHEGSQRVRLENKLSGKEETQHAKSSRNSAG